VTVYTLPLLSDDRDLPEIFRQFHVNHSKTESSLIEFGIKSVNILFRENDAKVIGNFWLGGKDSNICPLQDICKLFNELQSQENGIYKYL
jgi:hypothetical protein